MNLLLAGLVLVAGVLPGANCFQAYQAGRYTIKLDRCSGASWAFGIGPNGPAWADILTKRKTESGNAARFDIVIAQPAGLPILMDSATGESWALKLTAATAEWLPIQSASLKDVRLAP